MAQKNGKPGKGNFIISAPFLNDLFNRSVIYLAEHNDEGTVGFIINKPLKYKAGEIIDDFPEFDAPVYLGGPVQQEVVNFIHKAGDIIEGGVEIGDGIFWGGNFESMKILAESGALNPEDFIFFLGYAGWSPGQLDGEMESDSWYITSLNSSSVFSEKTDNMWSTTLKDMGGEYKIISTFPEDPSVN